MLLRFLWNESSDPFVLYAFHYLGLFSSCPGSIHQHLCLKFVPVCGSLLTKGRLFWASGGGRAVLPQKHETLLGLSVLITGLLPLPPGTVTLASKPWQVLFHDSFPVSHSLPTSLCCHLFLQHTGLASSVSLHHRQAPSSPTACPSCSPGTQQNRTRLHLPLKPPKMGKQLLSVSAAKLPSCPSISLHPSWHIILSQRSYLGKHAIILSLVWCSHKGNFPGRWAQQASAQKWEEKGAGPFTHVPLASRTCFTHHNGADCLRSALPLSIMSMERQATAGWNLPSHGPNSCLHPQNEVWAAGLWWRIAHWSQKVACQAPVTWWQRVGLWAIVPAMQECPPAPSSCLVLCWGPFCLWQAAWHLSAQLLLR